jgi:hypothetical protein
MIQDICGTVQGFLLTSLRAAAIGFARNAAIIRGVDSNNQKRGFQIVARVLIVIIAATVAAP